MYENVCPPVFRTNNALYRIENRRVIELNNLTYYEKFSSQSHNFILFINKNGWMNGTLLNITRCAHFSNDVRSFRPNVYFVAVSLSHCKHNHQKNEL